MPIITECYPSDVYEVSKKKNKIVNDLPILVAYFVYSYAKLRMLQFYYDFLDQVLDRADFELIEMDTGDFHWIYILDLTVIICCYVRVRVFFFLISLKTKFIESVFFFRQPIPGLLGANLDRSCNARKAARVRGAEEEVPGIEYRPPLASLRPTNTR
jgi:hypothetical protein